MIDSLYRILFIEREILFGNNHCEHFLQAQSEINFNVKLLEKDEAVELGKDYILNLNINADIYLFGE